MTEERKKKSIVSASSFSLSTAILAKFHLLELDNCHRSLLFMDLFFRFCDVESVGPVTEGGFHESDASEATTLDVLIATS